MTAPGREALAAAGVALSPEALIAQRARVDRAAPADAPVGALPGGFAIRKRGAGQAVADSRLYTPGDDARTVDRGATARTGELHVRTFHEERDRVTFLVADFRPSMLWGMRRAFRSVAAAEALAWFGWRAVEAGGRVGLLAVTADDAVIAPSRPRASGMLAAIGAMTRAHDRALAAMAAGAAGRPADQPTERTLDMALAGLERVTPLGAEIIIASALDRRGPGFDALIGSLARRRTPRFLLVEDGALEDLPAGRYPLVAGNGERVRGVFRGGARGPVATDAAPPAGFRVDHVDAGAAAYEGPADPARRHGR